MLCHRRDNSSTIFSILLILLCAFHVPKSASFGCLNIDVLHHRQGKSGKVEGGVTNQASEWLRKPRAETPALARTRVDDSAPVTDMARVRRGKSHGMLTKYVTIMGQQG